MFKALKCYLQSRETNGSKARQNVMVQVLETDWMSDEFSDLEDGTDEAKAAHRAQLQLAAKLTAKEIAEGVPVLEKMTPAFRSTEVL